MKCPYCAEQIQDEAILCRFCGATRRDGQWWPPSVLARAPERQAHPSTFTMKTAGAFFIISAIFTAAGVTSPVPLFGEIREGTIAILYHAIYAVLFVLMGDVLWSARRWGVNIIAAGTAFYAVDKLRYILDFSVRKLELKNALDMYGGAGVVDPNQILPVVNMVSALYILCWLGFLVYVYMRRDYFKARAA